jgi:hypothetical protein
MKTLLLSFFIIAVSPSFAQVPDWFDIEQRKKNYPEGTYRTGYAVQSTSKATPIIINNLKEAAKSELIESIQVSIKSESTLLQTEGKGQYNELFTSETVSLAEGDLVELSVETFFDKKKKIASAFAFVRTQKQIDYFNTVLDNSLLHVDHLLKTLEAQSASGNLSLALKNLFEAEVEVSKAIKAHMFLTIFGVRDQSRLKTTEIETVKQKASRQLLNVLDSRDIKPNDLAYYFVMCLRKDIQSSRAPLHVSSFDYKDYSFKSELGLALERASQSVISEMPGVTLTADDKNAVIYSGSYSVQGENIIINASLTDAKGRKVIRSLGGRLNFSVTAAALQVFPEPVRKAYDLKGVTLVAEPKSLAVKVFDNNIQPISIRAAKDKVSIADLPLLIYRNVRSAGEALVTNAEGNVSYAMGALKSPKRKQQIVAEVDLARYLTLDSTSRDFKKVASEIVIPKVVIPLEVSGNVLRVVSEEYNLNQKSSVPYIRSGIVDVLTKLGFEFTSEPSKADYDLVIKADTKSGGTLEEIFFSYLDASITVVHNKTLREVFSNNYKNVKGSGGSFESAGAKAYSLALKKIQDDIVVSFR